MTIQKQLIMITFLLTIVFSFSVNAQNGKSVYDTNWGMNTSAIDKLVSAHMSANKIPGLTVAVAMDGRLVFAKGYGDTLRTDGAPKNVSANSLFKIASVSKTITAATVMKLWEEGKFVTNGLGTKLFGMEDDGSIFEDLYLRPGESYGKNVDLITINHLLEFTSGGWQGGADPTWYREFELNHEQLLEHVIANTDSNGTWNLNSMNTPFYHNFDYLILGRVIEEVTKKSYEDVAAEKMLHPIEIFDMHLSGNDNLRYNEVDYEGIRVLHNRNRSDSAGGWIASAKDLVKFGAMLKNHTLIEDTTWKAMMKCDTPNCKDGKGWGIGKNPDSWSKTGNFDGTRAYLKIVEYKEKEYNNDDNQKHDVVIAAIQNVLADSEYPSVLTNKILDTCRNWPDYDMFHWNNAIVGSTFSSIL